MEIIVQMRMVQVTIKNDSHKININKVFLFMLFILILNFFGSFQNIYAKGKDGTGFYSPGGKDGKNGRNEGKGGKGGNGGSGFYSPGGNGGNGKDGINGGKGGNGGSGFYSPGGKGGDVKKFLYISKE